MKSQIYSLLVLFCLITCYNLKAQNAPVKWGKVNPEDFSVSGLSVDTTANAIILSEIGNSEFDGNTKGWFSLKHTVKRRILILKKAGFDLATITVPLYKKNDQEEKITDIKAFAYNLENGEVKATKMERGAVFEDKYNRNVIVKKFAVPGVKEGSIVEYTYTVISDFLFNLQPWDFQGAYPTLWSEYNLELPSFFRYVILNRGNETFFIKDQKSTSRSFSVIFSNGASASDRVDITGMVTQNRWVMKNMAALKDEPYLSSAENHKSHIEFQMSGIQFPNEPFHEVMGTWPKLGKSLMDDEEFGLALKRANNFLDDDIKRIVAGAKTPSEKSYKLFNYVRDNFTCTSGAGLYLQHPLKDVYRTKSGTVAEINLLLGAMLAHENIKVHPVIFSTRQHGQTFDLYPLIDKFNYTALAVEDDKGENYIFLDAARPGLGFNKLSPDLYNGHARIISEETIPIYLEADSLWEANKTFVLFSEENKKLVGSYNKDLGYFESTELRNKIRSIGKDAFIKKFQSANAEYDIEKVELDSLNDFDKPVKLSFNFEFKESDADMLYIDPFLGDKLSENPFKADTRNFPVEMPYKKDEMFILTFNVPEGYTVEELPKSSRVMLNGNEGMYEYLIGKSGDIIQLRAHLIIGRATFAPEDYATLRDFYSYVVKKQSEQIVLKKKK